MAKFNDKISTILNSQLPEFVVADHPKFAEFLKVYYQLLRIKQNYLLILFKVQTE